MQPTSFPIYYPQSNHGTLAMARSSWIKPQRHLMPALLQQILVLNNINNETFMKLKYCYRFVTGRTICRVLCGCEPEEAENRQSLNSGGAIQAGKLGPGRFNSSL